MKMALVNGGYFRYTNMNKFLNKSTYFYETTGQILK